MTELDTTQHFDQKKAEAYDKVIRQVVPGYETLHEMIMILLKHQMKEARAQLLSVGCGTGLELINASRFFPDWHFTGVEPSSAMSEVAKENLEREGLSKRCNIVEGFVSDLDSKETFDIATLILVMHFLPDDGSKAQILADIYERLKKGATLVLVDLNANLEDDHFQVFLDLWREWQLFKGMPEHIVDRGFENVVRDIHFISEQDIIKLLKNAGFHSIQPFYKAFLFGGWIAKKG